MSPATAASAILDGKRIAAVSELATRAGVEELIVWDAPTMRWLGVQDPSGLCLALGEGVGRIVPPTDDVGGPAPGEAPSSRGFPQISIPARAGVRDRRCSELTEALATARAVKDAGELSRIRAAADLVEAGHRGLRDALEPGASELQLWDAAARAITSAGGDPGAALVDLMVGGRTALIGEPPGEAVLASGDGVLFDLAPERDGYWADSCATVVCGDPSAALRERHAAVAKALACGLEAARPGVRAGSVDAAIRELLAAAGLECPHHTGHGVGVAAQEPPWFVPGSDFVLAQGMVIALEPGAYAGGFGVRLEHLAVIESGGATPLTNHPLSLIPQERR